jgi:hypothetical protein
MNQRKDNYRAALGRSQADPGPHTSNVTKLSSRYVRITIEVDPDVHRNVERWVGPPIALLANTGAAALRFLTVVAAQSPSSDTGSRT